MPTGYEVGMYADVRRIREALERIVPALERIASALEEQEVVAVRDLANFDFADKEERP